MIMGYLDKSDLPDSNRHHQYDDKLKSFERIGSKKCYFWSDEHISLCYMPSGIQTLDEKPQPFFYDNGRYVVIFEGKIYNLAELKRELGTSDDLRTSFSGELLAPLYKTYGEDFPKKLNGKFAFAIWDSTAKKLLLGRDQLGIEPLYYAHDSNFLCFGNSLSEMAKTGLVKKKLNDFTLLQYMLYCYNPTCDTLIKNAVKLPAGHVLTQNGIKLSLKKYWSLSFANQQLLSEDEYRDQVLSLIEDAIRIRLASASKPGILLSGGTDSSTMVSLTKKILDGPFPTFSFRCLGKSFDESPFARFVAENYGTDHTETLYTENSLQMISEAVKYMNEPFCDVGIEIGTFLLGRAARGKVSYTLSGEGGDELFAGHPVYVADKVAKYLDFLPQIFMKPATTLLNRIPDSDQKKNLQVKLKRFAYSMAFPPDMLSHRWRIYYTHSELRQLCSDGLVNQYTAGQLLEPMLAINRAADGADILSRSLYSDYLTLVDFYLRRLELLKASSIEGRLPLMDIRLVEYASKIPSRIKIKGFSDTKYIYRKILEPVLPRSILYDRPKLGHSIPMKNWIREDPSVYQFIKETISNGSLSQRGYFNKNYIEQLLDEHRHRLHNHSHRLWALTVLELWLQTHLD